MFVQLQLTTLAHDDHEAQPTTGGVLDDQSMAAPRLAEKEGAAEIAGTEAGAEQPRAAALDGEAVTPLALADRRRTHDQLAHGDGPPFAARARLEQRGDGLEGAQSHLGLGNAVRSLITAFISMPSRLKFRRGMMPLSNIS